MTTQRLTGFRYKEKDRLAYNHADSHPDALGLNVLRELRDVDNWDAVRDRIDGMIPIPEQRKLDEHSSMAETEIRRAFPDLKYEQSPRDFYDLYRPLQGALSSYTPPSPSTFIENRFELVPKHLK